MNQFRNNSYKDGKLFRSNVGRRWVWQVVCCYWEHRNSQHLNFMYLGVMTILLNMSVLTILRVKEKTVVNQLMMIDCIIILYIPLSTFAQSPYFRGLGVEVYCYIHLLLSFCSTVFKCVRMPLLYLGDNICQIIRFFAKHPVSHKRRGEYFTHKPWTFPEGYFSNAIFFARTDYV